MLQNNLVSFHVQLLYYGLHSEQVSSRPYLINIDSKPLMYFIKNLKTLSFIESTQDTEKFHWVHIVV